MICSREIGARTDCLWWTHSCLPDSVKYIYFSLEETTQYPLYCVPIAKPIQQLYCNIITINVKLFQQNRKYSQFGYCTVRRRVETPQNNTQCLLLWLHFVHFQSSWPGLSSDDIPTSVNTGNLSFIKKNFRASCIPIYWLVPVKHDCHGSE